MLLSIITLCVYLVQTGSCSVASGPLLASLEIFPPRVVQPDGFILPHFADKVGQTLEAFTSSRQ